MSGLLERGREVSASCPGWGLVFHQASSALLKQEVHPAPVPSRSCASHSPSTTATWGTGLGVPLPAPCLKGEGEVVEVADGAPPLPTSKTPWPKPTLPPAPSLTFDHVDVVGPIPNGQRDGRLVFLHQLHDEGFLLGGHPTADHCLAAGGQVHEGLFHQTAWLLRSRSPAASQPLPQTPLLLLQHLSRVEDFVLRGEHTWLGPHP